MITTNDTITIKAGSFTSSACFFLAKFTAFLILVLIFVITFAGGMDDQTAAQAAQLVIDGLCDIVDLTVFGYVMKGLVAWARN